MAISDTTAGVAALVSLISLTLAFWLPKKHHEVISLIMYALTVAVIATLIATSGGLSSPFVGAWFIIAMFAGYFRVIAIGGMAGLLFIQIFLSNSEHSLGLQSIMSNIIFGLIPLVLGSVLWHRQPDKKKDNTLIELAGKLSTVEGKSDVVINTIDDGVVAINKSGIIDLINPSAQTLVGWSGGDALGLDWRSVLKLVGPDGREVPENDNPVVQALASNKPTHTDKLSLETGSGKKRLINIVSSPVGSAEDGIIVVFRDITKEKAEEREQAEFISTASHEMRTPVASIEGYLGLALNPNTANIDEKAREFITKAHASAQHLGKLFQDLLDISKSEDGRLKNEPKIIDVSETVSDIFEGLGHLAADKQLRYIFKPNPSLEAEGNVRRMQPVFYADVDPGHFREVVSNLIENAIKYTPRGDVTVDVTGDDKLVTVAIQDTGIGIPAEDISHLFQKFYRVDNTDTREINGTGLGLYLSRKLAETMGGHLRVESEYGKGSTFFLDIPRTSHEDAMRRLDEQVSQPPEIITPDRPILSEPPSQDGQSADIFDAPSATPEQIVEEAHTRSLPSPIQPIQPISEPQTTPITLSETAYTHPDTAQSPQNMTLSDVESIVAAQPIVSHPTEPINIAPVEEVVEQAPPAIQQPTTAATPAISTPAAPQATPTQPPAQAGAMPTAPPTTTIQPRS